MKLLKIVIVIIIFQCDSGHFSLLVLVLLLNYYSQGTSYIDLKVQDYCFLHIYFLNKIVFH